MKPNNQQLCGPGRGRKVVSSRKSQDLPVLEGLAKLVVYETCCTLLHGPSLLSVVLLPERPRELFLFPIYSQFP